MGTRLGTVEPSLPKPLLPIGGRPLLAWSIDALLGRGIRRILVVVGHHSGAIRRTALAWPGVELVENPDYATTGSMASLASALPAVAEDFLLLEGDVLYDPAALDPLLARPERNVLLASGPTGAGDEVWVDARDGWLV